MEQEFKPTTNQQTVNEQVPQPQTDIKAEFLKGPELPQQPTLTRDQEIAAWEKAFKDELPFLRKKEEYNRLQLQIIEQDVMLGVRPLNTVGGLLGAELQVKEAKTLGFLAQFKNEMEYMLSEQNKMAQNQPQTAEIPTDQAGAAQD